MSWTTKPRLLTAVITAVGLASVMLTVDSAAAATRYSVNLSVSTERPVVGEAVQFSGRVVPAAPGKRVTVQGKAAGTGWVTIARPRLTKNSTYKTALRFTRAGQVAIRVVKPMSRKIDQGSSRVRHLRVSTASVPPVIVTPSLPDGVVGASYSARVATADDGPGMFTVSSGVLPAGLSLDDQTGVISGKPTAAGTSAFTIRFRNPDGLSDSQQYSVTVRTAGPAVGPVITTTTLPNGTLGRRYQAELKTAGNNTPGTWLITAGKLPPGLTGSPSTGVISGTPTTAGTTTFTMQFTETATGLKDTQVLSITVEDIGVPVIATTFPPVATAWTPYSTTLKTVGDKAGTWSITSGALPHGLNLNPATGVISGTPQGAGNPFEVTFTTPAGLKASKQLWIYVDRRLPPEIATTPLPQGQRYVFYAAKVYTTDARPGKWEIIAGSLPSGVTFSSSTNYGSFEGVPQVSGSFPLTVRFTSPNGTTDTQNYTLVIVP